MRWGRPRRRDVPDKFTYLPTTPPRPEPVDGPIGIECAVAPKDHNRTIGEACNQCGHQACGAFGQPCDICRLTIRIRSLEGHAP